MNLILRIFVFSGRDPFDKSLILNSLGQGISADVWPNFEGVDVALVICVDQPMGGLPGILV